MPNLLRSRARKVSLTASAVVLSLSVLVAPATATPDAGERLFPGLGNTGYDVRSYDVAYDFHLGQPTMASSVDIVADATQRLSSFSLDAVARKVSTVSVNGVPARFRLDNTAEKLVVTPRHALRDGLPFRVRISYVADRTLEPKSKAFPDHDHFDHWTDTDAGFSLMGQPDRSHLFFPMNDVPADKARMTWRVTVPKALQAAANGTLKAKWTIGGRTTYVFSTRDPIPTHVAQLAVGHLTRTTDRGPHGLPLRSYVDTAHAAAAKARVALVPGQMQWLEDQIGSRYPFETYGVLGVGGVTGYALESATLSMFNADYLTGPVGEGIGTMVHELTHQYFGNAVSVRKWDDMWLSEGHAVYYTGRYRAARGELTLDDFMKDVYAFELDHRAEYGPPGRPADLIDLLAGTNTGGAFFLYDLNNLVGPKTFKTIEHTFFERFRNRSASTQDYIAVANEVSGRDLTAYANAWIYGKTTPIPTGHPDWAQRR
ncbi:M1 family metallopeptidase [Kribbella sp. NPDC051770]|uniref:M1 family metallopeptidase n=1 Tax=Kribbella sp. NPDC051770 TaxID=3155413 RepID=UPI003424C09D